jgi:hypothetical protein
MYLGQHFGLLFMHYEQLLLIYFYKWNRLDWNTNKISKKKKNEGRVTLIF